MKRIANTLLLATLFLSTLIAKSQNQSQEYTTNLLNQMTQFYQQGLDEKLYLQLDKPYYSSNDQIWFKGYLLNAITNTNLYLSNFIYVELIDNHNTLVSRVKIKRDSTGFNGQIALNPEMEPGNYTLRGYTRWMLNKDGEYLFTKALKIISPIPLNQNEETPSPKSNKRQREQPLPTTTYQEYTLDFFPEGGALLGGVPQIVAFKALAEDGLSIEVSGEILDSSDNVINTFQTSHKGMGIVAMTAQNGEQYYARAISADGLERRFYLPTVESSGAIINSRQSGSRVLFQVHASSNTLIEGAHIVIHSHGRVVSASPLPQSKTGAINTESLFDGVNVISLVDASNRVLSERLFFKRPTTTPQVDITTNKTNYARREKASVKINVKDSFGEFTSGEFGVSITDNSSVRFDDEMGNILSYLLLSSDLHGHIESAGHYFTGDREEADRNLDLLMRTQGWRRFDLDKILDNQTFDYQLKYENEAQISGSIKGFFGNEARKAQVHVISSKPNYMDSFTLDKSNRFQLTGLDIPDSATYVIQSRTRKGGNTLTLNIDPEPFPEPKSTILPRAEEAYVPIAFVNQSQDKFFEEGGMSTINIDAVYVTTTKEESSGSSFATHATSREKLEMMSGQQLSTIIQSIPGMIVSSEGVFYRSNRSSARFIIDGMDMEYEDISTLTSGDIERLEFFNGADAAIFSDSSGGVFVIEMLDSYSAAGSVITAPGIAFVSQLGYQTEATFYQPRYHIPSQKANARADHRTTLFWSGKLQPNSDGDIEFEFYTADKATSYTILIEGVTYEGEICQASKVVSRTLDR